MGAAGDALDGDLLTLGQTLRSAASRKAVVVLGDLARNLARDLQDWLRQEGLSGTNLYSVPSIFSPSCYIPQGQEGLAGTAASSYGSEGWGFESLRARYKRAGQGLILAEPG
jgi:hypothetical protein